MTHLIRLVGMDGVWKYKPTVDGYYGLANPSHIGEGYNDTKYKKTLKVLPAWYGDDSEPFL